MTTQEVATRLVGLCREGKFMEAAQELYSPDIVSVEADGMECKGAAELEAKGEEFFGKSVILAARIASQRAGITEEFR